jgi:lysophosphatidylglycerol acyltransferase 1
VGRAGTRLVLTTINQLIVVPVWLLLFITIQPVRLTGYRRYLDCESSLYKTLLDLVAYWSWCEGFLLYESGADISRYSKSRCLVLANHQSTADIPTLFAAFHDKSQVTENVMWVSDIELMFSHVGVVMLTHGDLFLRQKLGPNERERTLQKIDSHLINKFIRKDRRWCVLFPEGGFLRKRRATSHRFAAKNGYPLLNRVTIPRVNGLERIINTVHANSKKPFQYLIDVTIAYADPNSCLGLPDVMGGWRRPEKTHVHYRVLPITEVAHQSREELMEFLVNLWTEKEELLNSFYSTGYFEPPSPHHVQGPDSYRLCAFDDRKYLGVNLAYACVSAATTLLAIFISRNT